MQFLPFSHMLWRSQRLRLLIERERRRPQIYPLRLLRLQALLLRVQDRLAEVLATSRPATAPALACSAKRQPAVLGHR